MLSRFIILSSVSAALVASHVACTHTPAGTSVEVALARRAEMVRMPTPPPSAVAQTAAPAHPGAAEPANFQPEKTERLAEAFSRGEFCLGAGKDAEAITAFEEAVKIDPQFGDAWTKLASLYEKSGNDKQAMDAYKRAKMAGASHPLSAM